MGSGFNSIAIEIVDFVTGDFAAKLLRIFARAVGADAFITYERPRPVDERIARIDEARTALAESLEAIDELRVEADVARTEHAAVALALQTTLASKDDAEKKLQSIQRIMDEEVEAFRAVAGVSDVRKERIIGFASGVAASIIATAIWTYGARLLDFAGFG